MSRNLKATAVTTGLYVAAFALGLLGAMVKPETRIVGTIGTQRVDIPAWLQNEPEYDKKIKNAKVEQGWGGLRLVLWGLGLIPAGLGLALSSERQGELEKERREYERQCREDDALAEVRSHYNVSLTKAVLQKKGEATIALVEDELEDEVDSIREANGWYAPEVETPKQAIEPPLLRQPEATESNPFEGMKTPKQYADELEAARQGAIARLGTNSGEAGSPPAQGEPIADPKFIEYQDRGREVMGSLASLKISILSAGATGCGKTHTMDKWLRDIRAMFPKADILAIAHKNDPFCGLMDEGRVRVFNPFSPEVALEYLDRVYTILQERQKTPKHKREALYDDHPVRLILDDWFATYQALKGDAALWRNVSLKLSSIITVGREFNVCLYVCTQSYNLEALGLAEDSNIRSNLAVTCQGFVKITTDENGKVKKQGDYTVLQQLIKNNYIVADKEDRDRLVTELRLMMALSKQYQVPLIFSAIDEPTLAIMPYITIEGGSEDDRDSASTNVAVTDRNDDDEPPQITDEQARRWAMEFDLGDTGANPYSAGDTPANDTNDYSDVSLTGDAQNDDSTSDSGDDTSDYDKSDKSDKSDDSSDAPDYDDADLEYLKWLPKEPKLIEILEKTDPGFSLSNVVRSKLKVTSAANAKRAKRAIMALVKKLNRADLWVKFEMDDINI